MVTLHRVFLCILFGLARFYAALPCHAAIVTRGLSLKAWKVPFVLGFSSDQMKLLLCCRKQWRFPAWQYKRVKRRFSGIMGVMQIVPWERRPSCALWFAALQTRTAKVVKKKNWRKKGKVSFRRITQFAQNWGSPVLRNDCAVALRRERAAAVTVATISPRYFFCVCWPTFCK